MMRTTLHIRPDRGCFISSGTPAKHKNRYGDIGLALQIHTTITLPLYRSTSGIRLLIQASRASQLSCIATEHPSNPSSDSISTTPHREPAVMPICDDSTGPWMFNTKFMKEMQSLYIDASVSLVSPIPPIALRAKHNTRKAHNHEHVRHHHPC